MSTSGGAQTVTPVPTGPGTPVHTTSGVVANAAANAAIGAAAGKTSYLTGFEVTGLGATAGITVTATINNGAVVANYTIAVPAGATTAITPLTVELPTPIPGAAVNTAVTVSVPAFGAGNTNVTVNAHGYQA